MRTLDIYKKLPQTNCGDCGEATCMVFALKVQTGQRVMADCPHIAEEPGTETDELTDTVDDSYEHASRQLEEQLRDADFAAAAARVGGRYAADRDVVELTMLNHPIEVRREGLFEEGAYCRDSFSKLIAYDYVLRKGNVPVTDQWVPFERFPKTPSHVKAFQQRAEAELAKIFENHRADLRTRLDELGSKDARGDVKSDLACRLELLPKLPLLLQFWDADDDFPAGCKLFVDHSAIDYLDIEFVARLVGKCIEHIVGYAV